MPGGEAKCSPLSPRAEAASLASRARVHDSRVRRPILLSRGASALGESGLHFGRNRVQTASVPRKSDFLATKSATSLGPAPDPVDVVDRRDAESAGSSLPALR